MAELVTASQFQLVPDVGGAVSRGLQVGGQLQALQAQRQAQAQAEQKQKFQKTAVNALRLQGLPVEAQIKELERQQTQSGLTGQVSPESQELLALLKEGKVEQANQFITKAVDIGQRLGVIQAPVAAGAGFTEVQTIGGKQFGIKGGVFQEIPAAAGAVTALQEQEAAKQEATQAKQTAEQQKTIFTQTQALRKEFESVTKPQQQSVEAFRSFQALQRADQQLLTEFKGNLAAFADPEVNKDKLLADAQAISDIALIFAFFKTVDPASTVREGEFATVENAGGVPTRFQNSYNRLLEGARLNKAQRDQIIRIAENKSKSAEKQIARTTSKFRKLAAGQKIDPGLVIVPEEIQQTEDLSPEEQAELTQLRQRFAK